MGAWRGPAAPAYMGEQECLCQRAAPISFRDVTLGASARREPGQAGSLLKAPSVPAQLPIYLLLTSATKCGL